MEDYKFFAVAVDNVGNTLQTPPAAIEAVAISGDVDGDGKSTPADVVALVNYISGNTAGISAKAADINNDNVVNIADVIMLMNYLQSKK